MQSYITHHFAHLNTLDRAYRWLLQIGFDPAKIESHREGTPWISMRLSQDQRGEAAMIFDAAESNDPDGWPSFWELAKNPHPHFEPTPEIATASIVLEAGPSPVGWHPLDRAVANEANFEPNKVIDVTTWFS